MKVVDLHPEELFDKEEAGTLSEAERARLDAHVARCDACRLERQLRADFADELGDDVEESRFPSSYLVEIVAGASREEPAAAPKAAPEVTAPEEPEPAPVRRAPRRRTRITWLLAAAAVACVGVAAASETSSGRWIRRVVGVDATEIETNVADAFAPHASTQGGVAGTKAVRPVEQPESPSSAASVFVEPAPAPAPPAPPSVEPEVVRDVAPVVAHATTASVPRAAAPAPTATARSAPADQGRWAAEPEGASALLEEANVARRRGDYARAIVLGRRLQGAYPDTREAHISQATLGRLLLDTGDPAGALASFDAYLAKPGGELDEAVMVGRGIALDRLGRADEAKRAWSALLEAFPSTPYAEHARSRTGR